ncbi:hypothetical protein NKH18_06795 [Streptomyces sp. M10(2022)]
MAADEVRGGPRGEHCGWTDLTAGSLVTLEAPDLRRELGIRIQSPQKLTGASHVTHQQPERPHFAFQTRPGEAYVESTGHRAPTPWPGI